MKNSLPITFSTIFIFILGSTMAQTSGIEAIATDEATASAVEASEQKKKTRKKTAAAIEIYQIETNQAAELISRFVRKNITYPASFRDNSVEPEMMVDFFIDRQGVIQKIKITKGEDPRFNQKVLEDLVKLKDIKIRHYLGASRIRIPLNFSLR